MQGKRSRAVRYCAAAGIDEDVFLHPTSALHATAPGALLVQQSTGSSIPWSAHDGQSPRLSCFNSQPAVLSTGMLHPCDSHHLGCPTPESGP